MNKEIVSEAQRKLRKVNKDRRMLRILLHKLKLQIEHVAQTPSDDEIGKDLQLLALKERRASYRKRLDKLNRKRLALKKVFKCLKTPPVF